MASKPLPSEDQLVTMVYVREGNIYVTSARVLVCKDKSLALQVDTSLAEPPEFGRAQPLTLLYVRGDRVLRLKAVVRETIDAERLTIEPVGDVKEGDRRDFRRADVTASVYVGVAEGTDIDAARARQLETDIDEQDFGERTLNLSGSGVQFASDIVYDSGTLLDIRLLLPLPTPARVSVIAEVVRMLGEVGDQSVAARFAEVSEADQDLIVYTVFSRYFEDEGLAGEFGLQV